MSVPRDWGKCKIPSIGSPEYREKYCDPNKKGRVEKDTSTPPPKPEQDQPGQLPQADAGNRKYPEEERKILLMRDSGGD
ncbi:MAG: hypothetical protein EOM19_07515 [Candidatus Moranbacteria bacterium]|nr:hypothetical protein [Candidatus Moranbacteria bacterium]